MAEQGGLATNRVFIQSTFNKARQAVYDFTYGQYIANYDYFSEMTRIQTAVLEGQTIRLSTGIVVDLPRGRQSDLMALNTHMEYVSAVRNSVEGFSTAMLSIEKKIFTSLQ